MIKSLKIKKYRWQERLFLVEGRKNVREVLLSDMVVQMVIGTKMYFESRPMELGGFGGELMEVNESFLIEVGTFQTNQDCVAVVEMREPTDIKLDAPGPLFLLDGVSDPGNLGTIIRTLDWFAFTQVACSPDTADYYNPKVIHATMGSFCRVKVTYTSLDELIKSRPYPTFGTDMRGTPLHEVAFPRSCQVVLGSESHGIRDYLAPYLTATLAIPAFGKAESLNVGVAAGIIAYKLRQP